MNIRQIKKSVPVFFSEQSMAFFDSVIETEVIGSNYFVTSEKHEDEARMYTIRRFDEQRTNIETVGEYNTIPTLEDAVQLINDLESK